MVDQRLHSPIDYSAQMAKACLSTQDHAELLAMKWWMGTEFRRRGEYIHFRVQPS